MLPNTHEDNVQSTSQGLLVEKVLDFLRPGGRVALHIKAFEAREQQLEMMRNIIHAYNQKDIALVEAGTGTGKSMAYLLPAILWAVKFSQRTVISTHTITLQEQLLKKDIPMLLEALGLQVKAVLVKGMGNYVCARKLDDALLIRQTLPEDEARELDQLQYALATSGDGSRNSLSMAPSANLWERVGAETDTCNYRKCQFFDKCHFVKARAQATDAQILIVNHHLLCADLVKRAQDDNYTEQAVLPAYSHVVIDEAHNFEDVATSYFGQRIGKQDSARLMTRLASERVGKLTDLKRLLTEIASKKRSQQDSQLTEALTLLSADLMGLRREINQQFSDLFDAIEAHVWGQAESAADNVSAPQETKMRLLPRHIADPNWQAAVVPLAKRLSTHVGQFSGIIHSVITRLNDIDSEEVKAKCSNVLHDLQALNARLRGCASTLLSMTTEPCPDERVRWIETYPHRIFPNVQLIDAKLSVAEDLQEGLFKQFDSITLCSATMTVSRNFQFLKTRLGIAAEDKRQVIERIYDSPFDYNKQALLAIPTDLPDPTSPLFHDASSQFISQAVQASQGHALVLFTSYQALQQCYNQLQPELEQQKFSLMKQGDEGRYMLLERFRTTKRSVLFATYSFWEGVDIPGDALRCVIIVKLPFKVPSEPIIQARTEAITATGGDAFSEYSLPLAIVKFKQGFGRLIRRDKDRGCILCLDTRLITKRYGNAFLNSLPESKRLFATSDQVLDGMRQFYRQTHHFTTQG